MKKILVFAIMLLNLLPNIENGSMRIGVSTISAQMMGSESIVYRCNDDDIGWYTSPVPCDDEPCTTACLVDMCPWSGDCDDLEFHNWVEHNDNNDPPSFGGQDDDEGDESNESGGSSGDYGGYGTGNSGSHNSTPSTSEEQKKKNRALYYVSQFSKVNSHSTKFNNLSKEKFVQSLTKLINSPSLVQQGRNGTCGAAVLCKFLLEKDPELFAKSAINLYINGDYSINENLHLYLPESAYSGTEQQLSKIGTTSVDAIMQGAIVNWAHYTDIHFLYNPFLGESSERSLMLPWHVSLFCDQLGYNTETIYPSPFSRQLSFSDLPGNIYYENNLVIGLVYQGNEDNFDGIIPCHYVQILNVDNKKITYWSWGGSHSSNLSDESTGIAELIIVNNK